MKWILRKWLFKWRQQSRLMTGLRKANPIIIEPIMDMEIVVPEEYMGAVIGDLNSRRAKIVSLATARKCACDTSLCSAGRNV